MPPTVEGAKPGSSNAVVGRGMKEEDEINTHTSGSVCSSSSSTEADSHATTGVVAPLGARGHTPTVRHCADLPTHVKAVHASRTPTSPTPCCFLDDGGSNSTTAGALSPVALTATTTVTTLGVLSAVSGTSAAVPRAPTSPASMESARRTPAPPPPIDFFGGAASPSSTAAAASTTGAAAASTVALMQDASTPLSSVSIAAGAGAPLFASPTGSASRPSASSAGLHPYADPFYPERLTSAPILNSLTSTPQQTYVSPSDYVADEPYSSPAASSAEGGHGDAEQRPVSPSQLLPSAHLGQSGASLAGGAHASSPSHALRGGHSNSRGAHSFDLHWQDAVGGSQYCHGVFTNPSAGAGTTPSWAPAAITEELYTYDGYGGAASSGDCMPSSMSAMTVQSGAASAGDQGGMGVTVTVGGVALGRYEDVHATQRTRGPYATPALPDYAATPASLARQAELMGGFCSGGDNEYGGDVPPSYDGVADYAEIEARFTAYVPQEVVCIERMEHLEHVCREILLESEVLRMQRQQRRRERQYCADGSVVDDGGWDSKMTLALDLEGRSLGRTGSICIITLATVSTVYIIDVVLLGADALRAGAALRRVLESREILKLMFDCRADCDALFFLYSVRLQHVCDLQISSCFALFPMAQHLPGMKTVFIALGLFANEDADIKNAGRHLFNPGSGGSFDRWEERPLTEILLQYCAVDVKYFFLAHMMLWDHVETGCRLGEARLQYVCSGNFLGCSKNNSLRDFDVL